MEERHMGSAVPIDLERNTGDRRWIYLRLLAGVDMP